MSGAMPPILGFAAMIATLPPLSHLAQLFGSTTHETEYDAHMTRLGWTPEAKISKVFSEINCPVRQWPKGLNLEQTGRLCVVNH
jgi:hypothetical protein